MTDAWYFFPVDVIDFGIADLRKAAEENDESISFV